MCKPAGMQQQHHHNSQEEDEDEEVISRSIHIGIFRSPRWAFVSSREENAQDKSHWHVFVFCCILPVCCYQCGPFIITCG